MIVVISYVMAIYLYPLMPKTMASHWDINGNVDGYMPKAWGLFIMPLLSSILLLIFVLIPFIDPLRSNIEQFRKHFDRFIIVVFGFLFYIYLLTLLWNKGIRFNMIQLLSPAFAILIFFAGILIKNSKRNWSIGIRTPWTLSSDLVWHKTHVLGAKLFLASSILSLLGVLFPQYAIILIILPLFLAIILVFAYSYLLYEKERSLNSKHTVSPVKRKSAPKSRTKKRK